MLQHSNLRRILWERPKSPSAWGLGERRGHISGDRDYRERGNGWIWEGGKATGSEKGEQKHTAEIRVKFQKPVEQRERFSGLTFLS